jgi:hypothetical protein
MKTDQQLNYSSEVKQFIISACRQRLMLLRSGRSLSSNDRIYDIAKGLENDAQNICNDIQAASFMRKRSAEILALLPGKYCKGIAKRVNKYNELVFKSNKILAV